MSTLSPNAQLVSHIFDEVARGNGAPFWEACHDDLVWRTDRWVVQIEHVHESAVKNLRSRAKREIKSDAFGPNAAELTNRLRRAYRILLTRAIRGAYVWVKDEETRAHLHSALRS